MNFYLAQTVLNSIWTCAYNYLLRVSKVTAHSLISMHYQLTNLIAGRLIGSSVEGAEEEVVLMGVGVWGCLWKCESYSETQNERSSPSAPLISPAH